MKFSEFSESTNIINEVPMNPSSYAQSLEVGFSKGVKVGFEFEVCIPEETVKSLTAVKKDWTVQVMEENPTWYNDVIGADLFRNAVDLNNATVFGGEYIESIDELGDAWISSVYGQQIKKAFEALPEKIKVGIVNRWKVGRKGRSPVNNNESHFYEIARHAIYSSKNDPAVLHFIGLRKTWDYKQFWIDLFGTVDLTKLVQDDRLVWDKNVALAELTSIDPRLSDDNKNTYELGAYCLKPILEKEFGQVKVFNKYHEKKKDATSWYIEPDGSLVPNDSDSAVEVVTPPLPVKEGIDALKRFYQIAKQYSLYTSVDNGTGLHINVSIPDKLDVLKLAVFTGDEHVLREWDREDHEYAVSIMKYLRAANTTYDGSNPIKLTQKKDYKKLLDIAKDISSNHVASISYDGKYVSFRHAGGDYLNEQQDVLNVVGRFVRAMVIAADPGAYRKEYLTKLSSLFVNKKSPQTPTSGVASIVRYKTSPIPVVVFCMYANNQETSPDELLKHADMYGNVLDKMTIVPLALSQHHLNDVLSLIKYPDVKEVLDKNPNNRVMGLLNYNALSSNYIKAHVGTATYICSNRYTSVGRIGQIGRLIIVTIDLQPGDPLHTIMFKKMISDYLNKVKNT